MDRFIYFLTHPEVVINPNIPITDWSLSETGRLRVKSLLKSSWIKSIDSIYCSDETKATDTADIIKTYLSVNYSKVAGLREVDRSKTGYLSPERHKTIVELFYAFPFESIFNRERAVDAQLRIVNALKNIIYLEPRKKNILIVSHGGVAALLLAYVKKEKISINFSQPNPNGGCFYVLNSDLSEILADWNVI